MGQAGAGMEDGDCEVPIEVWTLPRGCRATIYAGLHGAAPSLVVERTFAWVGRYCRMSKDYEYLTESSEALIHLTMSRLMLRRLAVRAKPPATRVKALDHSFLNSL